MARQHELLIDGRWRAGKEQAEVRSPWDGSVVGLVAMASAVEIDEAIDAAVRAFEVTRRLPAHRRAAILLGAAEGIRRRREELATTIADEAGKPIKLASIEVDRAIDTFTNAAEEAKRIEGGLLPLDGVAVGEGRLGLLRRFPIGPVGAITPFNFPLNLVAHKVAPAIACGCPLVLKPASQTPLTALLLGEICQEAGLPAGALNIVPSSRQAADKLVTDERLKLLTFTGSAAVGWDMKARAGRKKVVLELGGNAAAIVDSSADLGAVAKRLAVGAYAYAGQSCISVQRIFVHNGAQAELRKRLLEAIAQDVRVGPPRDPEAVCGPLIDGRNADRVAEWIGQARASGAKLHAGGERREHNVVSPALLSDVDPKLPLSAEEAFGPVVLVDGYDDFEEAIRRVNASAFGLQAGVFSNDLKKVMRAFEELQVGGVIHNDYPTYRTDPMPYGGVKDSGLGREGPRYAIEDMTEPRLLVLNP